MPKIEEDGKSWLRRPKLYRGVVEPYKKKKQPLVHVMGRDDIYPVMTSKVGSLLHYVIAYLG